MPIVNQDQLGGESERSQDTGWVFESHGHLKPGVTPAQAVADVDSVSAYLEKTYPKEIAHHSTVRPGRSHFFWLGQPVREHSLAGLMLLAGLILLAACANLGSLFAARAADRSREVALRLALGSSRKRILRQLLTEAVLISLRRGAVGVAEQHRVVAQTKRVAAHCRSPDSPARYSRCKALLVRFGSGPGQRIPVRHCSGSPGAAGQSV
jgi:hypothetical protein